MTSHDCLAVIGAISVFVAVATAALRLVESVSDRRRARRAMARFGVWNPPADHEQRRPSWLGFVAAVLIVYAAAALVFVAVSEADCGEEHAAAKLGMDREARSVLSMESGGGR